MMGLYKHRQKVNDRAIDTYIMSLLGVDDRRNKVVQQGVNYAQY